jgi:hypothetical protein
VTQWSVQGGILRGRREQEEDAVDSQVGQLEASKPHTARSQSTLRGGWLLAARVVWIIAAVLIVAVYLTAVPITFTEYQRVCAAGTECRPYWRIEPEDLLALRELRISVGFYAAYRLVGDIIYTLGFWAIGALIFWKKSADRLSLFFSFMLITFGALNIADISGRTSAALSLLGTFISYFGSVSFFLAFFIFPDGRLVPRWTRWPMVVWTLYMALLHFVPDDSSFHPRAWSPLLSAPLAVSLFSTLIFAQIYRYLRVSGPVERQQTKWVVFGLTTALVGSVLVVVLTLAYPTLLQPGVPKVLYSLFEVTVTNVLLLLIPLSIGVAILRYRLWNIDVIINRTLVYGSLSAVLAAVFAITDTLLLPLLVQAFLGKEDETLNAVISAVIIAVLFEPLRRRIKEDVKKLTDWLAGSDGTSDTSG